MGEGEGGGGKDAEYPTASLFPPPLYPLPLGEGKLIVGQSPEGDLAGEEESGTVKRGHGG